MSAGGYASPSLFNLTTDSAGSAYYLAKFARGASGAEISPLISALVRISNSDLLVDSLLDYH